MVQDIKVEKLNAAPYNPRVKLEPGMIEYEKLKASIEEFGNVEPIVWNKRTGNVVGGHQRLAVLVDLYDPDEVPCEVVDLSESDEKVLNVALNKIRGEWDYDKLEEVLDSMDYDLASLTGFGPGELAILRSDNSDLDDEADDLDDWYDEEDEGEALGLSYMVTLVFENKDVAQEWLDKEGSTAQIKPNSGTLLIRIDDEEESA